MIIYTWARLDSGRVLGAHMHRDDAVDVLPRVAFRSAEEARSAAESDLLSDWDGVPPDVEWAEDIERQDGRYPTFEARIEHADVALRVYPIEIVDGNDTE